MAYHNNIATPALPPACLACLPATHILGVFVLRIAVDYLDWNSASLISPSVPLYADSPLLFSSTDNLRGGLAILYISFSVSSSFFFLSFFLTYFLPHRAFLCFSPSAIYSFRQITPHFPCFPIVKQSPLFSPQN